jgi:hypothetical protein
MLQHTQICMPTEFARQLAHHASGQSEGRVDASEQEEAASCAYSPALWRGRFDVEVVLSKEQRSALEKYRNQDELLRAVANSVPRTRVRWVEELLALRLSQSEAADLLGITRGHLP